MQKLAGPTVELLLKTPRQSLAKEPVSGSSYRRRCRQQRCLHRLHAAGIATFEADLNTVMRYLIDRGYAAV